ncbi:MAG: phage major capsid protein [Veillonellales bacterium]
MSVSYDRIARDIAFTLEVKSPKVFENIFLNNGVLAMLGDKARVKIVVGGNRFDERVRLGQNSNVDHRDKHTAISTTFQDNVKTAYYGQSVCDGAVPVNLVEQDQNAGDKRIQSLAEDALEELKNTFPNKIADALMKATSTAVDPTSIVEELQATATGSQTRTTGGIARSSYPGTSDKTAMWQTQYNTTAADLSGAAGIGVFQSFLYTCSQGGSAVNEMPDIGITTNGVLARMGSGAETLKRYQVNDKMLNMGFNNFLFGNTTMYGDRNVTATYCYVINTNYARVQILAGPKTKTTGNVKTIGEGKTAIPLQILEPVRVSDKLQYNILAYLTYNLTFGGLRQHGLKTGLTES